jgi:para-nitrobenzyl esterase
MSERADSQSVNSALPGVRVETSHGRIEGLQLNNHQAFLGIPFAAPPTGTRRFRAPEPATPWQGVRETKQFGFASIQGTHPVPGMAASGPRNEDCLYLNVYTPAADHAKRPVLFWIHGGGFVLGSGSEALYNGAALAQRGDVVVVTIHYRLGALGYLYLGGHGGDRWGASANLGQLDQIAALAWVRANIGAFGGDADNVTVFGESAGSMAAATLLAMPAARGLFRRAILESGAANRVGNQESGARVAAKLLAELGIGETDAAKIREVPADAILKAQLAVSAAGMALPFAPIVEGKTLPENPLTAVAGGVARDVELIIGSNRDEAKLFNAGVPREPIDEAKLIERVARLLPKQSADRAGDLVAVYRESRTGMGLPASNLDLYDAIQSDEMFRIASIRLAEAQAQHRRNTRMYLFVYESPARRGALGACHALEIPFVFGTLDAPTQDKFAGTGPAVERLAHHMMDAWLGFATRNDPSHIGIGGWDGYDSKRRATMLFGLECAQADAPFEAERAAWDGIF